MGPNTWGPHGWRFFHYITLGYPINPSDKDIKIYKKFFKSIGDILPCSICRNNYKDHIKQFPLTTNIMNDREELIKWGIKMHNLVNKELGKKIYTNEEVINDIIMEKDCNLSKYNKTNIFFKIVIAIIIIWMLLYLYNIYIKK
jgi:hypothetical protein